MKFRDITPRMFARKQKRRVPHVHLLRVLAKNLKLDPQVTRFSAVEISCLRLASEKKIQQIFEQIFREIFACSSLYSMLFHFSTGLMTQLDGFGDRKV